MDDEALHPASPAADLSTVLIPLLKGVTYRADDAAHVDFMRFIRHIASHYSAAVLDRSLALL